MQHHAFVIETEAEEGLPAGRQGIEIAKEYANKELGIRNYGSPDLVVLQYGLLSVAEARRIAEIAAGKPFAGEHKVIIIAASRVYHEAQNALLKLFEEPPTGTFLFLIVPTVGSLLPTLRSRVQILENKELGIKNYGIKNAAEEFLKANKEKRSAIIKRLTSGKGEEERRELRDEALAIVNGIETALVQESVEKYTDTLREIAVFRSYLYERSAPVKMILEHLAIVTPRSDKAQYVSSA